MNRFIAMIVCLAALSMSAQQPPAGTAAPAEPAASVAVPDGGMPRYVKEETPSLRMARLATPEDPGVDPHPDKRFWRYSTQFRIQRYELRTASFQGAPEGFVRPYGPANFYAEVYQVNDKYVWVWWPAEEPKREEEAPAKISDETINYVAQLQPEFSELKPAESGVTIRFKESSGGLPNHGSWRNALDVADANGDGFMDLILPPERKGAGTPAIYVGDGKGKWTGWPTMWPYGVDYGAVAAADLNKDGHTDVVSAVHLVGLRAFLGDGKGNFKDASEGLPSDYPTRRVALVDVDRDGDKDIIAIHEGPTAVATATPYGKIRTFLNTNKATKWQPVDISPPGVDLGGDYLAVGNFNGDRFPDVFGSSVYLNATQLLYVSESKGKWKGAGGEGQLVPAFSYYYGVVAGKFASKQRDDVAVSFVRLWPTIDKRLVPEPKTTRVTGIELLSFGEKGPRRKHVVRWASETPMRGLASGDFDGDGNLDLIYTPADLRSAEILLGDGRGEFKRATVEGLPISENFFYDLKVADVNQDKRPDVIIMYETNDSKSPFVARDGSVHVFLGQGGSGPVTTAKTAKK